MCEPCSSDPGDILCATASFHHLDSDPWIPALSLLILARFETGLFWAPSLGGCADLARMSLAWNVLERFERSTFQATTVRNVSKVGANLEEINFRMARKRHE